MFFKKKAPLPKLDINIELYTTEQLCEIENFLNSWRWPDLLGERPEWWDRLNQDQLHKVITPVHNSIIFKVGEKKLLRYHWLHNLGATELEFEDWYEARVSNHVFAPWIS